VMYITLANLKNYKVNLLGQGVFIYDNFETASLF